MKIAVNARCLFPAATDQVSRYTDGLLRNLTKDYPQHEFYFFSDRPFHPQDILGKNISPIQIKSLFRQSFLGHWWYWASLAKMLKKIKPDVFLSTDGLTVFIAEVPRVTFMPLIANAPENKFFSRQYLRHYEPKAVQLSEKIIVNSPENGQKLRQKYAIAPKEITVAIPAANHYFKTINFAQQVRVRQKYAAGESYFFLPELPLAEENLKLVIAGFHLLKERTSNDLKLIIVGKKIKKGLLFGKNSNLKNNAEAVIFTGPVTANSLAALYAAAVATIYFPETGGINLTVLEAQQSGCPLIIPPSPEAEALAGTSALIFNTPSAEGIFTAMALVYHQVEFRTKLVKQGLENAARFTWSDSSRRVMQLLETTVKAKNNAGAPV